MIAVSMNGDSEALEDIVDSMSSLRREVRDMRGDIDTLAQETRAIALKDRRFARWGAFIGTMLGTLSSITVNQCAPAVVDAITHGTSK